MHVTDPCNPRLPLCCLNVEPERSSQISSARFWDWCICKPVETTADLGSGDSSPQRRVDTVLEGGSVRGRQHARAALAAQTCG